MNSEKIKVFYGEKTSEMPKSSSFLDLKREILQKKKLLLNIFLLK